MDRKIASSESAARSDTLSRWWIVAGVIAVVACGVEFLFWRRLRPPQPKIQSSHQITRDGIRKDNLVASTDGTQLYFNEFSSDRATVMRVSTAGGAMAPINTDVPDPRVVDISPQSELLISSGESESGDVPFWALSTTSASAWRLGEALGHDAVWEPRGRLVFVAGNDFFIAEHDGSDPRKFVTASAPPFSPHFSPDGSRFRFTIGDPNNRSTMWEARADGGGMAPILPLPGWKAALAPCCGRWTPDGKYFVFVVTGDVWIVADRPGTYSEPVQLTSGPLRFKDLVPSWDGKRLFAIGAQPRAELVRYDAASRQFVPFLDGISARDVDFSPDGQSVAYVTYPDGLLWRSKIDGTEQLRLTSPPMQAASARWSPDGKYIAFAGLKPGEKWKVLLVSKDGGTLEVETPDSAAEADPIWSPDGRTLAFVRFTRPSHIVFLDLDTHARLELPNSEGLWRPRWSPDGHLLVALSGDSTMLMMCDHPGQKWRRLASTLGTIGVPAWSHDGRYIYLDATSQHDAAYLRVRASDGKVKPLAHLKDVRRSLGTGGPWTGLAPGDIPLLARDTSIDEVYALNWQLP